MVTIISSSRYKINRAQIKSLVQTILSEHSVNPKRGINIVFAGRKKLRLLSKTYKQEDVALPVLTFIYNEKEEADVPLAEILICYPQAVLLSAQKNKKVDETISRLVKHGLENIINNI